ncbi:Oidioi.mRNA.OKI2018_I69.chr1.g2466.t1.cds [Oikopleura dioica]|uniref:Oidioi.mRNA.OKI2018_I69.chr1.g2466.t1.cds n=1 Tax=Oikopleura dioica TaxID=34765 RepID=A0ABN7SV38_OIKDI|nr:Oidioi.mRNA.OKI2018_I69.chr1.g2466.t1.cds [Oikopleura dioica]
MNKKTHACFFLTVFLLESTVARSIIGIEGPKPRNQVKYFGEEIILSCTSYFDDKFTKWPPKITWLRKFSSDESQLKFKRWEHSQIEEEWFIIPLNQSRIDNPHSPKERIIHFDRFKYISKIIFPLSTQVEDGSYACVIDDSEILATATVSVISPRKDSSLTSTAPDEGRMLGPYIILALSLVVLISAIFLKFRLK